MTKVFISYSHDSDQHREFVRDLSNRLRSEGLECLIDQYINGFPSEGWLRWMEDQIEVADFVLMVCTETYLRRYRGKETSGGKGVNFEGAVISQNLYDSYYQNTKFIPVIPADGDLDNVPTPLKSFSTYRLPEQYGSLYRYLTTQPEYVAPPVGQIQEMPAVIPPRTAPRIHSDRLADQVVDSALRYRAQVPMVESSLNEVELNGSDNIHIVQPTDIFISYSRKDAAMVSTLARTFEESGYSVWWDINGLHGGQSFSQVIQQELSKAKCAIVIWSPDSVKSNWVQSEASFADKRGILLTAIYREADAPMPFNTRHNEDLRGWNGDVFDDGFQRLLSAVARFCPAPSGMPRQFEIEPVSALTKPISTQASAEAPKAEEYVMIEPAKAVWEKGTGPITRIDNSTGDFMRLVQNPAEIKQTKSVAKPSLDITAAETPKNAETTEKPNTLFADTNEDNSEGFGLGKKLPIALIAIAIGLGGYLLYPKDPMSDSTVKVTPNKNEPLPKVAKAKTEKATDTKAYELANNLTLLPIPAGSFKMGSDSGAADEKPVHDVTFAKPFWMSKTEITFAQYDAYATAAGKDKPDDKSLGRDNRPAINVSWNDAQGYVKWLSNNNNQGLQCRLPSEAEWEYAARAESTTKYPWGNTASHEKANYGKDEKPYGGLVKGRDQWRYTAPVGSFPANLWGLHDMNGNVWEWVQDSWHKNYMEAPDNGEAWEKDGDTSRRVLRGGSWVNAPGALRSAGRDVNAPGGRGSAVGFRLVCSSH